MRYWAAAREAAGQSEETTSATTCAELVAALSARDHGLARVLAISSFLIDGRRCSPGDDVPLPPGAVVEVLPPFAGG